MAGITFAGPPSASTHRSFRCLRLLSGSVAAWASYACMSTSTISPIISPNSFSTTFHGSPRASIRRPIPFCLTRTSAWRAATPGAYLAANPLIPTIPPGPGAIPPVSYSCSTPTSTATPGTPISPVSSDVISSRPSPTLPAPPL